MGPLHLSAPDVVSLDWRAAVLALVSVVLVFRLGWSVLQVLGVAALLLAQL